MNFWEDRIQRVNDYETLTAAAAADDDDDDDDG